MQPRFFFEGTEHSCSFHAHITFIQGAFSVDSVPHDTIMNRKGFPEKEVVHHEKGAYGNRSQNAHHRSRNTACRNQISSLNSTLSKARSNLSKLRSEYNSLKASYETDQLDLKHTPETDTAAGENAEYHYEITCATIEDELEKAQSAYDTAAENVRIFEENLADGYVYAKQDGIIYSLNCQAGRSVNLNTSYVSYEDESSYYTTVELDQNEVTQVSIGDSVLIYSSETGTANGKVTAIAAGESTSLADVRFNVTVTADEDADLYSGESVNVYFNAGNLKQSDFRDFDGSGNSERQKPSSDGDRPDFGRRKDD